MLSFGPEDWKDLKYFIVREDIHGKLGDVWRSRSCWFAMEWELSLPSSDSRDFVGLYSNSNGYPCLMPGKENLALLLAHSLFPLSLEDLKKLFPGGLVYSLWFTTFNFIVMSSFFVSSKSSWNRMIKLLDI